MSIEETELPSPYSPESAGRFWHEQITHAEGIFDTWFTRGSRVVERYRDERDATGRLRSKYNILWSNTQVMKPSLYGRQAKPEVSRRYQDSDPAARMASTMLERVIEYEIDQFPDFHSAMDQSVEDRLLPGRGTIWMRYEPVIETSDEPQVENIVESPNEKIVEAHSPVDYVYWKDFLHSPARTWDEVWWVARAVYMTLDEGLERFGPAFGNVPLTEYKEDNSKRPKDRYENAESSKKAKVWEIWNKREGKVCWLAKDYPLALDERDDPLGLEEFFPCPKPLYATTTNGSLIPVPDYVEYQDQAEELDSITGRLTRLVKAVKAIGVFNGEFKELGRLLSEGVDNKMFPVSNWAALAEKNGLKGAIDMLDVSAVVQAISVLQAQRDAVIQTIYQISGISDIMRGSTKAEETLGAQQLKANFGNLRMRTSQADVARFASDIFKLKAQIICRFYPPALILQMSGVSETPEAKSNPQVFADALAILQDSRIRDFHIAVESDSLAQIDDQEEKASANEAIVAISKFMSEWLPVVAQIPQVIPMVSEMLLFLIRRYRAGRQLESVIEQSMKQLQAAAMAPKGPSKEQIEAQTQAQIAQVQAQAQAQAAQVKAQADTQAQTSKLAAEGQLEQMKQQMEAAAREHEAQLKMTAEANAQELERLKIGTQQELDRYKVDKDAETKKEITEMQSATQIRIAMISASQGSSEDPSGLATNSKVDESTKQMAEQLAERFESMIPVAPPDHTAAVESLKQMVLQFAQASSPITRQMESVQGPAPAPAPTAQIIRREVVRGPDARISHVIHHMSDGTQQRVIVRRDEKGRLADLTPES